MMKMVTAVIVLAQCQLDSYELRVAENDVPKLW